MREQLHGLPLKKDSLVLDYERVPLSFKVPTGALFPHFARAISEGRLYEVLEEAVRQGQVAVETAKRGGIA